MTVLLGVLAGAALAYLLLRAMMTTLQSPVLERTNYRGAVLPTAGGMVVVLAVVAAEGVLGVLEAGGVELDPGATVGRRLVVLAVLGFGLLGFVDDVIGAGQSGGFRGHIRALASGRLTSGGIKLVGGAALSLVVVAAIEPGSVGRILADGALVALTANLANLFDRAPGRTIKVSALGFAVLVALVGAEPELLGVGLVVGAGLGLLEADLRERLMVGDVGANVLGAALGIGVVLTCTPVTRTVVLVVVAGANLISEWVSFSRVIERVAPLRALDRLGRRPLDRQTP
ncbi:MAG: UDP-N-acetylmuramyl pentapeptide phosphotransferase/UDP-N-acetylglucosamine-phosphate transferase [Acidimicrobiales bacterium]|nr:UDP-N-acetylmuramyl pentapeptide phosphotransferase/UDP-N-acetylglucosamine-phosphate transferase [Acidimicrobiales bacterium]